MTFKEVLGAIGLWAVFFVPLALTGNSDVLGGIIIYWYMIFFAIVILIYIVLAIFWGKMFYGREAVLQVFIYSILVVFAFLAASTIFKSIFVLVGVFIAVPLAFLHIEIKALLKCVITRNNSDEF